MYRGVEKKKKQKGDISSFLSEEHVFTCNGEKLSLIFFYNNFCSLAWQNNLMASVVVLSITLPIISDHGILHRELKKPFIFN